MVHSLCSWFSRFQLYPALLLESWSLSNRVPATLYTPCNTVGSWQKMNFAGSHPSSETPFSNTKAPHPQTTLFYDSHNRGVLLFHKWSNLFLPFVNHRHFNSQGKWQNTRLMTERSRVSGLSPSRSSERIFFPWVNFLCWLQFHICFTPVLLQ